MRDTFLWRLCQKECARSDCDTKYEWISDIRNNEMKISKSQLKQIITEEIETLLEQDAQAMMVRGAKGAGQDQISVDEISISSDGSFKATLSSTALSEPLKVAGKLDFNSTALLQQAGAVETPAELTGPAKELMEIVDRIKDVYESGESGMPPSLEQLEKLVRSSDFAGIKSNITHIWNDLLKWHQKDGSRLQHKVTTSFNTINTIARRQTG